MCFSYSCYAWHNIQSRCKLLEKLTEIHCPTLVSRVLSFFNMAGEDLARAFQVGNLNTAINSFSWQRGIKKICARNNGWAWREISVRDECFIKTLFRVLCCCLLAVCCKGNFSLVKCNVCSCKSSSRWFKFSNFQRSPYFFFKLNANKIESIW